MTDQPDTRGLWTCLGCGAPLETDDEQGSGVCSDCDEDGADDE